MKKLFVLLGVFCALCFVACSNFQLAGGDMGVVSLSIGDNLAREIRSAAASRNVADGTYTLTASIRGEYSDSQTVAVANGNYSGVTFTFEDVPVGKNIILDLTAKADGNYIWYGNSGKHMVVSGINNLNVAVGRVSGVLLWKRTVDGGQIAPYGNLNSEDSPSLPSNLPDNPFWCFDNTGNLYWYGQVSGLRCYKSDNSYRSSEKYNATSLFSALSYDNVASILYGILGTQILKLETSGSNQIINFYDNGITPIGFAVHNGIAYVADKSSEDDEGIPSITIVSFDLTTKNFTRGTEFKLPTVFGSQPTYQMIYQDGALYLLLGSVSSSSNVDSADTKVYSCGALVKINPSTLTIDTSFGNNGYLGLVSTERQVPYTDSSGQKQSYSVYAASSPTEKVFSKPLGFVAIMPKKLVIADAGCIVADETVDQGGVFKLRGKAVSRIVTVDLETQSLGFEDLDPSQYYWTDLLGSFVVTSSSYF